MSEVPDGAWDAEFDRVWPLLERALAAYGDTHTKDGIRERCRSGLAQLWTNGEAAIVTSIERYDTGLSECHQWLAGGEMDAVLAMRPDIEAWAKSLGCTRMMIVGRKGWARVLPDYRPLAVTFAKELA